MKAATANKVVTDGLNEIVDALMDIDDGAEVAVTLKRGRDLGLDAATTERVRTIADGVATVLSALNSVVRLRVAGLVLAIVSEGVDATTEVGDLDSNDTAALAAWLLGRETVVAEHEAFARPDEAEEQDNIDDAYDEDDGADTEDGDVDAHGRPLSDEPFHPSRQRERAFDDDAADASLDGDEPERRTSGDLPTGEPEPDAKSEWPELVGLSPDEALAVIKRERPDLARVFSFKYEAEGLPDWVEAAPDASRVIVLYAVSDAADGSLGRITQAPRVG